MVIGFVWITDDFISGQICRLCWLEKRKRKRDYFLLSQICKTVYGYDFKDYFLFQAKNWQMALELHEEIKDMNIKPTISTMNALITSLCMSYLCSLIFNFMFIQSGEVNKGCFPLSEENASTFLKHSMKFFKISFS